MSYVTYNINVVSLDLVCNKHLLYIYDLLFTYKWGKRDFPSCIITFSSVSFSNLSQELYTVLRQLQMIPQHFYNWIS